MPLLSPEQMEQFKQQLHSGANPEPTSAVEEGVAQVETAEPETQEVEAQAVETEPQQQDDDFANETEGHNVPYKRFKKVIESRNALRGEIDELKQQLEELSASRSTDQEFSQQVQEAEEDYDEALANLLDPSAAQLKSLEKRMFEFEVAQEKVKLNQELANIREDFPDVPEQVILEAILKDSSVDAYQVAEQYSLFVGQIEEQGVAKYLERQGNQPQAAAPAVPTRVGGQGGATNNNRYGGVERPKSIKTAKQAVIEFLNKNRN